MDTSAVSAETSCYWPASFRSLHPVIRMINITKAQKEENYGLVYEGKIGINIVFCDLDKYAYVGF